MYMQLVNNAENTMRNAKRGEYWFDLIAYTYAAKLVAKLEANRTTDSSPKKRLSWTVATWALAIGVPTWNCHPLTRASEETSTAIASTERKEEDKEGKTEVESFQAFEAQMKKQDAEIAVKKKIIF